MFDHFVGLALKWLTFTLIFFDKLNFFDKVLFLFLSIVNVILPCLPYFEGEPMSKQFFKVKKEILEKAAYCFQNVCGGSLLLLLLL